MKNCRKKSVMIRITALFLSVFILNGCSFNLFNRSTFDAAEYTKATLDALTKGEFDSYMEQTNSTKEEAQKSYDSQIEKDVQALLGSYYSSASDQMKQDYTNLFKKMYSKLKYEVGEKMEGEKKSYTVPVTTEKMIVFKDLIKETQEKLSENKQYKKGKLSQNEILKLSMEKLYDVLNARVDNATYDKPETISVTVAPISGNENTYQLDSEDWAKLFQALIDLDELNNNDN